MTEISVVLPFFQDNPSLFRECLESVRAQTFPDWECLLIGDGPSPETLAVAHEFAFRDPRFCVHVKEHAGIVSALNRGLSLAEGSYIARMDADDTAHPDRLSIQLDLAHRERRKILVGARVRIRGGMSRFQHWVDQITSEELVRAEAYIDCAYPHPTWFAQKRDFLDLGGYLHGDIPEDYDLFMRMVGEVWHFSRSEEQLVTMTHHPDRLTLRDRRYRPEAFRECKWSALRAFFSNGTPILIAGGGRTARWWLKRLQEHEVKVLGLLDIRPSRIGKKILGVPVLEYDALDLGGDVRYLVAVPRWEQRQEIRSHFRAAGRREGVDYVCVT